MSLRRSDCKGVLDKLLAAGILKPSTLDALTECFDPFHDTDFKRTGLPDGIGRPSVVRYVKKSMQLSSPFSDKTIPWDAVIWSCPDCVQMTGTGKGGCVSAAFTNDGNAIVQDTNTLTGVSTPLSPITIVSGAVGFAPFPTTDGNYPPASNPLWAGLTFESYHTGETRPITRAIEVTDVSAVLNKQGTITVGRQPQTVDVGQRIYTNTQGSTTNRASLVEHRSALPPASVADLLNIPASRQWAAEFGAYAVDTFDIDRMAPSFKKHGVRTFTEGDDTDFLVGGDYIAGAIYGYAPANAPSASSLVSFKPVHNDGSVIWISGANGLSTFTVTAVEVIEIFPGSEDHDSVTLETHTPDYDPMFIELYKRCAQVILPGCEVGENASGDFWDNVLSVIKQAAPVLAGVVPELAPLVPLISGGAGMLQTYRNKPKEKNQASQNQNKQKQIAASSLQPGASAQLQTKGPKPRHPAQKKASRMGYTELK